MLYKNVSSSQLDIREEKNVSELSEKDQVKFKKYI
jgi:hypothetical protein